MSHKSLRAAQALSIVLAVPMTIGSVIFSVISPERHEAAWKTWTLAPVAFACGIGLLVLAPRLVRGGAAARRRLLALLCVVEAFSLIKLLAFHETASVPFLVVGALAIALLQMPARRIAVIPES